MPLYYKGRARNKNKPDPLLQLLPPHLSNIALWIPSDNRSWRNPLRKNRNNSQMERVFPPSTQNILKNLIIQRTITMKCFAMIQALPSLVMHHLTHLILKLQAVLS